MFSRNNVTMYFRFDQKQLSNNKGRKNLWTIQLLTYYISIIKINAKVFVSLSFSKSSFFPSFLYRNIIDVIIKERNQ